MEKDFDRNNENCIEWISGEHYVLITYTERKWINRVKKLYSERKDEFKYFVENSDGSVCAKFPKKWIKNNPGAIPDPDKPKKVLSDEQKAKIVERFAKGRASKKSK